MAARNGGSIQGRTLDHAAWVSRALELRSKKSWSWRRIGDALGLHFTTVRAAVLKEYARVQDDEDAIRQLRDEAIDAMERSEARLVRSAKKQYEMARAGDINSAFALAKLEGELVKVRERKARLQGTESPTKQEITGKDGSPLIETNAADDVLSLLARRASEGEAGESDPKPDSGTGDPPQI